MNTQVIEEALRSIEERAALLHFLARCAAASDLDAEPVALNGMAEVCSDIQTLAQQIRRSLPFDALAASLKQPADA